MIWLLHQVAQSRLIPFWIVAGGPECRNWRGLSGHRVLERWVCNILNKTLFENNLKVSASNSNIAESPCQVDIFVILNQVLDGQEEGVQGINDYVLSEMSSCGNRYWVGINSSETFLVDRVLTDGWGDLLFSWVSHEVILEHWVNDENWFQVMNIFSLLSLRKNVDLWTNGSSGNLW